MANKNQYLTRQGLRQYLETTDDSFATRSSDECPVALFLTHETKRRWKVSFRGCVPQVNAEVEKHEFALPVWAKRYIETIDTYFGPVRTYISADEALYLLNETV